MKCKILRSGTTQYYVRVVASNGYTLAHSENYNSWSSANNCARLIAGGGSVEDGT